MIDPEIKWIMEKSQYKLTFYDFTRLCRVIKDQDAQLEAIKEQVKLNELMVIVDACGNESQHHRGKFMSVKRDPVRRFVIPVRSSLRGCVLAAEGLPHESVVGKLREFEFTGFRRVDHMPMYREVCSDD